MTFFSKVILPLALSASFPLVSSTAFAAPPPKSIDAMNRWELQSEIEQSHIGGPIALLASGGALVIGGAAAVVTGVSIKRNCVFDTTCQHQGWLTVGVPALAIGTLLATTGGVMLAVTMKRRRRLHEALHRMESDSSSQLMFGLEPLAGGSKLQFRFDF